MRDLRRMIENLERSIAWRKESLDRDLARVAEKAAADRTDIHYLSDVEEAVRDANETKKLLRELELQVSALRCALDED